MPDSPTRRLRTLVVDSNEAVLAGIARWAAGRPELVIVGTARSGPDALEAIEELRPELVLIDAVLPELDGLHVVRVIKARPNPPLAVITTLLADATMQREALATGADAFVPKDDFTAALELVLEELIERSEEAAVRSRARSGPRESRTERDP